MGMITSGLGYAVFPQPLREGPGARAPVPESSPGRSPADQPVDPGLQINRNRREESSSGTVADLPTTQRVIGSEDVSRPRYERQPGFDELPLPSRQALSAYQQTAAASDPAETQQLAGVDLFV